MEIRAEEFEPRRPLPGYLWPAAVGIAVWELAGRLLGLSSVPPFSDALKATFRLIASSEVQLQLAASVSSLVAGFGISAVFGVALGALMGRFRTIEALLDVYLDVFLASPSLIYVPILFAFFGVGRLTQVGVIILYSFFVIVAYTLSGVRSVDKSLVQMARSFGADERRLFLRVTLPSAWPMILVGLRVGAARAVKGMINGEMFIAFTGLGALLKTAGDRVEPAEVWGLLLIVLSVALIFLGLLEIIPQIRWSPRGRDLLQRER